jgi:uncharacterized coiled-coil protein SlyX
MTLEEAAERIGRLEANLSHAEHQAEQLNEVVIEQGKEIVRLRKQLERLSQTFEAEQIDRIRTNNPPPPHYGRG